MRRCVSWLALALLTACSEGPIGPEGPPGPVGPPGPQGEAGPGITVVSAVQTITPTPGTVPQRYGAAVTLPGVRLTSSVVNCWLQNPQTGISWKMATDTYGTGGLDACLVTETLNGTGGFDLLVSFGTRDSFWNGYAFIVTAAYSQ